MGAMAKVTPEQKAALLESGTWADFVLCRTEHITQGDTNAIAQRKALEQFRAHLGDTLKPVKPPKEPKIPKAPKAETRQEAEPGKEPDERLIKPPVPPPKVEWQGVYSLADFEGREASEVDIVRWVVRNMNAIDVTVADCPDPGAWNILMECRMSIAFRQEFMRTMWTKIIPNRAALDVGIGAGIMDGRPSVEMCDRLLEISEAAKSEELRGGSAVTAPGSPFFPGDAGSTPAPATISGEVAS